jgi:hypothetical protein
VAAVYSCLDGMLHVNVIAGTGVYGGGCHSMAVAASFLVAAAALIHILEVTWDSSVNDSS